MGEQAEYAYDVFISHSRADGGWVRDELLPRLQAAGLRVALSDIEASTLTRLVTLGEGIRQAKRTVVVLSPSYLADHMAQFESLLAQAMDMVEATYRVLPVQIAPIDGDYLPVRLGVLATVNLTDPRRAEREFDRLVRALRGPLPRR